MKPDNYDKILYYTSQIDSKIKKHKYNKCYEYYFVQYPILSDIKQKIRLSLKSYYSYFKHCIIYGEYAHKMYKNYDILNKDIPIYLYCTNYDSYKVIYDLFKDNIINKKQNKIFIMFYNTTIILNTQIRTITQLLTTKKNNYYNCCLYENKIYYHPLNYYILNQNLKQIEYENLNNKYKNHIVSIFDDTNIIIEILNDIKHINNSIDLLQFVNKYMNNFDLFVITLLVHKHFNLFEIILLNKLLPLNFFTKNYVIFDMIDHGYVKFFNLIHNYEVNNHIIFNFNTLNKDGYLPIEYLLIKYKESLLNAKSSNWPKIQEIYLHILNILLYQRDKSCMSACECKCNCNCYLTNMKCKCKCKCICNESCSCHLYKNKNACLCNYLNTCKYTRHLYFFDYICKTKFLNRTENEYIIKIENEVDYFFKNINNYSFSDSFNKLNLSIKKINYMYLNIMYELINGDNSPISIDDIITYIKFNWDFIDYKSFLQLCKNNKSMIIITELLKEEILTLDDYNVLEILIDLNYFNIIEKQNNYKEYVKKHIKNYLIHSFMTYNEKAIEFIHSIDDKLYETYINNNNDNILHWIINHKSNDKNKNDKHIKMFMNIIMKYNQSVYNNINKDGENCIFNCIKTNYDEMFKTLLYMDVNIDIKNINGNYLIHEIINYNCENLFNILYDHNDNNIFYQRNDNGDLPVLTAVLNRNINIISKLIKKDNTLINYSKNKINNDNNSLEEILYIHRIPIKLNSDNVLKDINNINIVLKMIK